MDWGSFEAHRRLSGTALPSRKSVQLPSCKNWLVVLYFAFGEGWVARWFRENRLQCRCTWGVISARRVGGGLPGRALLLAGTIKSELRSAATCNTFGALSRCSCVMFWVYGRLWTCTLCLFAVCEKIPGSHCAHATVCIIISHAATMALCIAGHKGKGQPCSTPCRIDRD